MRALALAAALLAVPGCYYQATLGGQRSPDGRFAATGGLMAGVQINLGDRADAVLATEGSATGYSSRDGSGYAVTAPVALAAHVRVAESGRHALAVTGEAALSTGQGSATFTPAPGSGSRRVDGWVAGSRTARGLVAVGDDYLLTGSGPQPVGRVRTSLGLEAFSIAGPDFQPVVTVGPVVSVGVYLTAHEMGGIIDCLMSKHDRCDDN